MIWFTVASLIPAALLGAACLWGGPFTWLAILSITVIVFGLDRYFQKTRQATSAPAGIVLTVSLALAHFSLWVLGIWAIGADTQLASWDKAFLAIGLGLYFGQVSNSNAHELIHSNTRSLRRIGTAIYCSLLHGHHVSAHLRVHHVHAATWRDPNSARLGEGFWRYLLRAARGELLEGYRAEAAMAQRATAPPGFHPYIAYGIGACVAFAAAGLIAGGKGVLVLLGIAAYAQIQLHLSDYVQHYGLERRVDNSGRVEPMGPQHSWNAPHWYSSAMMLNAPRHSDHHMTPARAFPALRHDPETMPTLPHSLPVIAVIALVPRLWRRVMDKRVRAWMGNTPPQDSDQKAGDFAHATQ